MTLEEVQAQLASITAERDALKANRDAILTEKKTLKSQFDALVARVDALDSKGADEEDDEPPAPKKKGSKAPSEDTHSARELAKRVNELTERLDRAAGEAATLKIDRALSQALEAANVSLPLRPAVTALLKTQRKLEVSGDAVTIDGAPVSDVLSAWAASDEGKPYIAPPINGGSAAPAGSGGAPSGKPKAQWTPAEKGAYIARHGVDKYMSL